MAESKHEKYARHIADAMRQRRAHDFYSGRGEDAKYLGTALLDGDVGRIADGLLCRHGLWREDAVVQKYTEEIWEREVNHLLTLRREVAPGSVFSSWPHRHRNSRDTDYSWWFQAGGLYLLNLGALVEIKYPNGGVKSKLRFPTFTTEENTR